MDWNSEIRRDFRPPFFSLYLSEKSQTKLITATCNGCCFWFLMMARVSLLMIPILPPPPLKAVILMWSSVSSEVTTDGKLYKISRNYIKPFETGDPWIQFQFFHQKIYFSSSHGFTGMRMPCGSNTMCIFKPSWKELQWKSGWSLITQLFRH